MSDSPFSASVDDYALGTCMWALVQYRPRGRLFRVEPVQAWHSVWLFLGMCQNEAAEDGWPRVVDILGPCELPTNDYAMAKMVELSLQSDPAAKSGKVGV